ncbi:MAG: tryptophan synthase subunit alpha [SAR202 cluster bacterium]|nr:tryptophan synthase subunit alpha [SAR202 cluster bacterium]
MNESIARAFEQARREQRPALIPYVTIGFPSSIEDTVAIVPAIEQAGADIIELGVPYSDPLADGPTIQAASERALRNGVNPRACIDVARRLREAGVRVPLLFMGYYNPILRHGVERYARDCADAGVDGLIIPDLPSHESAPMLAAMRPHHLALIRLLAPTSTEERIRSACAEAEGFIYCASVTGVTGARADLPPDLPAFVGRVRKHTSLPIAVGFGISERRHVESVARVAEGAIVGSRLIAVIDSAPPGERARRAAEFVAGLVGRSAAPRA